LQAHADSLNILHGRPALTAEEIETNYPVGIDMRVHRNWSVRGGYECHFWWFCNNASDSGSLEEIRG
jgi:hypothetical protein